MVLDDKRTTIVKVRLSDGEVEHLDARRGGCPRARYMRGLLLGTPEPIGSRYVTLRCQSMDEIVHELNKIGVNVNQLVRLVRGLSVAEQAEVDAARLRDGMLAIARAIETFDRCNDCVLHNEYNLLGLGGSL
ncbi:plasmid mobilization protein [Adlercreutzia muris]|uniref:plasmid mobilization protein n=1 Tax=Adlercreutzia muris TaxID=1796610 RepID=UPI003B968573